MIARLHSIKIFILGFIFLFSVNGLNLLAQTNVSGSFNSPADYLHDIELHDEVKDLFTPSLFDSGDLSLNQILENMRRIAKKGKANSSSKLFGDFVHQYAFALVKKAEDSAELKKQISLHSKKAGLDDEQTEILLEKVLSERLSYLKVNDSNPKWRAVSSGLWRNLLALRTDEQYEALAFAERLHLGNFKTWIKMNEEIERPWHQGNIRPSERQIYAAKSEILNAGLSYLLSGLTRTDLEDYSYYRTRQTKSSPVQLIAMVTDSNNMLRSLKIEAQWGSGVFDPPENMKEAFSRAMKLSNTTEEFLEISRLIPKHFLESPIHTFVLKPEIGFLQTNPTYDQIKEFITPYNQYNHIFPSGARFFNPAEALAQRIKLTAESDPAVAEIVKEILFYNPIEKLQESDLQFIDKITRPIRSGAEFMSALNAIASFQEQVQKNRSEIDKQRDDHLHLRVVQNAAIKFVLAYLKNISDFDLTDQEFQSMIKMAEKNVHRNSSYLFTWEKAGREYLIRERVSREFAKNPNITNVDHHLGAMGYGAANSLMSYNTIALDQLFRLRAEAQAKAMKANPRKDIPNFTDYSFLKPFMDSTFAAAKGKDTLQEPRLFIPELTAKGPQADIAAHFLEALSRPAKNWDEKIQNYEAAIKVITERVNGQLNSGLVARLIAADIDRLPKSQLTADQGAKLLNVLGEFIRFVPYIGKLVVEGDRIQTPASQYDSAEIQRLYKEIYQIALNRALPEPFWTIPVITKIITPKVFRDSAEQAILEVANKRGISFTGEDYTKIKAAAPWISPKKILLTNLENFKAVHPERAEALMKTVNFGIYGGVINVLSSSINAESDQAKIVKIIDIAMNLKKPSAENIVEAIKKTDEILRFSISGLPISYAIRDLFSTYIREFMETNYSSDQAIQVLKLGMGYLGSDIAKERGFFESLSALYGQAMSRARIEKEFKGLMSFSFGRGERQMTLPMFSMRTGITRFSQINNENIDRMVHAEGQTPGNLVELAKEITNFRMLGSATPELFLFDGNSYGSKAQALIDLYDYLPVNEVDVSDLTSLRRPSHTAFTLRQVIREILGSLTKDGLRVDSLDPESRRKLKDILGEKIQIEQQSGIKGLIATYRPDLKEKLTRAVEKVGMKCSVLVRQFVGL